MMKSLVATAQPIAALWLALAGRLAYFAHLANGHRVAWKRSAAEVTICPGDIVCDDCDQVLWCRAHDPWRAAMPGSIPDHWGATRFPPSAGGMFESLQRVLQLADECPRGAAGDAVRRAACELVEADSAHQRRVRRRRMLKAVTRLERWHARQPRRSGEASVLTVKRLTAALRQII